MGSVGAGKDSLVGIATAVARCKLLHQQPVNLLSLAWQSEPLQEQPQGLHQVLVLEVEEVDIAIHDRLV